MRQQYNNDYYDEEEGYEDEYEEEEEEQEQTREPPKSTKEEKEYLRERERLKEKYRQKLLKETASALGRSSLRNTPKAASNDKFGSFFGPSSPGIAPRVIEETKSMKENGYLHSSSSSKPSGSSTAVSKGTVPMSSRPKSSNGHSHRPRVVNEVKKKVEILKDNRDYSFLFSDDADVPPKPSTINTSQSKSNPSTSQPSSAKHIKEPLRGHLTGSNGKSTPSAGSTTAQRHLQQQHPRQGSTAQRHPQQQLQRPGTSRQPLPQSNRPRPMPSGSHRSGPSTSTKAPTKAMAANKAPMKAVNGTSNHRPDVKRTTVSSNSRSHVSPPAQQRPTEQRRIGSFSTKPGMKSAPPSKSQPSKQISSSANGRAREREDRNVTLKKKPVAKRPFDDEDEEAISMIRKMFNYNPNRWAGSDEDDSDMEVGFDVIQKEELRSLQIARKEDEEQLRLIEEEERRERMRKKRKLQHG
ncbi:SPT2 chromatin protein [Rhynchospora pubera]|uniref:SPT2 chromatin protein n=1 Tax=Rhynchospora pubera TaxID=906938 RepID=A0AAV8HBY0_9POAL|nr:SPT2 chromatin protein [Rhynchospora pubera]